MARSLKGFHCKTFYIGNLYCSTVSLCVCTSEQLSSQSDICNEVLSLPDRFYKTTCLNEVVNYTEPSPSVRVPWTKDITRLSLPFQVKLGRQYRLTLKLVQYFHRSLWLIIFSVIWRLCQDSLCSIVKGKCFSLQAGSRVLWECLTQIIAWL